VSSQNLVKTARSFSSRENKSDVTLRSQLQKRVSTQDAKKTEADVMMRSQLQKRVSSQDPEKAASCGKRYSFSDIESEADVTIPSQLQRRVASQNMEKADRRERSSSFPRPPKPPTEAQSEPKTSDSFSDVEIRSIDGSSVEVSHVNKWSDNTEQPVEKQSMQQRLTINVPSDVKLGHVTSEFGDSFPTISHIDTSESFEPGDSPQSDAQNRSNRKISSLKDLFNKKSLSESDADVPHRLQLQRRVSSQDMKKAEADMPMRSQRQRRVYSLDSKIMAIRERNSSFSRPSIPATEVQSKTETSDPGDLPEPFARIKSIQKNMSFEDALNCVSISESEPDVAVRLQLQKISSPTSPMKSNQREFDFYAPRGLLGIVIESSPRGPMVQSISHTSPLLGMIDRGDYIIGLDGMNTKGMTGAQLTLSMAQRSEQPQRKISFLSCGGATKC